MRAAATGVSHFVDQLLRPLFDRVAKQTSFITDLYTMIPRDGTLHVLQQFLSRHATNGRIHGMSIDTIM